MGWFHHMNMFKINIRNTIYSVPVNIGFFLTFIRELTLSSDFFCTLTASPAHQYAAATQRAWRDERRSRLLHVPFATPHAALGASRTPGAPWPPGANAPGAASNERTAVPVHDAASAAEAGEWHQSVNCFWLCTLLMFHWDPCVVAVGVCICTFCNAFNPLIP